MLEGDQEELSEEEKLIFSQVEAMGLVKTAKVGIKLLAISIGYVVDNEEELRKALKLLIIDIEVHARKIAKNYANNPNFK